MLNKAGNVHGWPVGGFPAPQVSWHSSLAKPCITLSRVATVDSLTHRVTVKHAVSTNRCVQGPFYCGVGSESVYGRPLAEKHMAACVAAGLGISGINAEVMPGQWEFQIGPVGPLEVGDEVMLARWLLHRLGEEYGIISTFNPKPVKGDWNGEFTKFCASVRLL